MSRAPGEKAGGTGTHAFSRDLGLTHREFFRSLPPAIGHRDYRVVGNRVHIEDGGRSLVIELGPEEVRSIAALRLPHCRVHFRFDGFTTAERIAFMDRFERCFQRGGG